MQTNTSISRIRKTLYGLMLLLVFTSVFGTSGLTSVHAQTMVNNASLQINAHVLSDGQFVYGPNIGDFDLKTYLNDNAPHLVKYADDLYGRSEYFSINPRIYLTLLEVHGNLISKPDASRISNPFDLPDMDFTSQIEYVSDIMSNAYYLHLYSYSSMPVSQRKLSPFITQSGEAVNVMPDTNAGTYAIIAALAGIEDQQHISQILDNSQSHGFYQTYIKLFGNDNPLDETNQLLIPGASGVFSGSNNSLQINPIGGVNGLVAPSQLLQLPFLRGLSWKFGGVHDNTGCSGLGGPDLNNCQFTDASSMDFYPNGSVWGMDTSSMWVVAAASGIPTRYSDCGFKVSHSGAVNMGWETVYYHLEGAKYLTGSINQNDKIGVIANTEAEATCTGGAASGPHVHFSLKYNGAYVAINGTALSGWYVHAGRWSYDTDPGYMWLEKVGLKKYAYNDFLLSEAPPASPIITGNVGVAGASLSYTDGAVKTVIADGSGNYSITIPFGWSGTVTPNQPGYTFTPVSRSYSNLQSNQADQNYTATDAPIVLSSARVNATPTSALSVDFTVTFSELVTGVDISDPFSDFELISTGLTGATITSVSGSGSTYTVTVNTGSGSGMLRLDVVDDDSIVDVDSKPLGGVGVDNGIFTSGEVYEVNKATFLSTNTYDGWILESTETSGMGSTKDNVGTTLRLGDDVANKQYRAILSFDTSSIPDSAVITSVMLKFKHAGVVGTVPFGVTHGNLLVDMCKGTFSGFAALQPGDFNVVCSKNAVMAYTGGKVNNWYSKLLGSINFQYINLAGKTQFRLRFSKDDNNDFGADFLKIYSGNAVEANRPQLVIEYNVP